MPHLIKQTRLYKPLNGITLNRSHPLCPDVFCCPIWELSSVVNVRDLVNAKYGKPNGGTGPWPQWGYNATGVTYSQLVSWLDFGSDAFVVSAEITVILGYVKRDTTLRVSGAVGSDLTSASNRFNVHIPFTDGIVYWDYGNISSNGRLSVGGLSFGPSFNDVWAFTAGARGMEIWRSGVLVASQAGHSTAFTGGGNFTLGHSTNNSSDWADYNFCYIYSKQLLKNQVIQISANPWQIFGQPKNALVTGLGGGAVVYPINFVVT